MWALERTEPSSHIGSAFILLAMTALTAWAYSQTERGGSGEDVWAIEAYVIIAVVLAAGAIGLLTRTRVGLVLGGIAAVILVVGGLQWALYSLKQAETHSFLPEIYHMFAVANLAISGAGIGIIVSLFQPRRHQSTGMQSGTAGRPG